LGYLATKGVGFEEEHTGEQANEQGCNSRTRRKAIARRSRAESGAGRVRRIAERRGRLQRCSRQSHHGTAPTQGEPPPKTVAQLLGEITWLMTQSPRHKSIPLGDLESLIMPAILLKQFRMFYKGEQPVGVAVWALADEIVAKRIDAGDKRLTAVEWKSGANMRIVDVVAPFGGEAEMRGQVGGL
jgi:cytolysin-activating lysine-acyltransferase